MGKRDAAKPDRYFQLHHYMLKTDAWRALSAPARAVYVQIGARYNGANNGKIPFSVRDAASECNLARNTAGKALKELAEAGFIEETRHGGLSRKTRIASEWRLTAFRCDLTESPKTCTFMQRGALARQKRLARSRPQSRSPVSNDGTACLKRRPRVSQTTAQLVSNDGTVAPTSVSNDGTLKPVFGGSPVSNDGTLIIYHPPGREKQAGQRPDQEHPLAKAKPRR